MATLILSTVGRVFGGRMGAAIGAVAGQAIDGALFPRKGREGPRLTELAIQTSSYGTQLPKVFGTMRVAGCVIWSTDLIESRNTSRSGKGQPTTTNYSYAASFAVAVSGRPIQGIGRIWADGKLLRGAAGDFKTMTGFRLHLGHEDQTADPVIAAAESGTAPAHRGIAYVVFENFQVGDYGNRLPSLTFEVIGDAAPVSIGDIAAELGRGTIIDDTVLPVLEGFSAYGDSVRGVVETLATAFGARFVPIAGGVRMTMASAIDATLGDDGFSSGEGSGAIGARTIMPIDRVPRVLSVAHYDPARDYQTGLQRARRPGAGHREHRINMPAALSADRAKTLAEGALVRAEAAREQRTLQLGWSDLAVTPGACVQIADAAGRWRVSGWKLEQRILSLTCSRIAEEPLPATASPGRSLSAIDEIAGPTMLHAFEIPPLDDTLLSAPRVLIAAGGAAGWRSAALLYSVDGGATWLSGGGTAAPATLGTIAALAGQAPATLIDDIHAIDVMLSQDAATLTNADDAALAGGTNIALVGDELLQFGRATQIGPAQWRLSRLLRGRRGTEAAIGRQVAGDRFVLLEPDSVRVLDLPLAALGGQVMLLASGPGDVDGPAHAATAVSGASILPPAPAQLRVTRLDNGDVAVRWVRRSRAGWRWNDRVDSPLVEERESYRATIEPAAGRARTLFVEQPEIIVAATDLLGGGARITVAQRGSWGESPERAIDISSD